MGENKIVSSIQDLFRGLSQTKPVSRISVDSATQLILQNWSSQGSTTPTSRETSLNLPMQSHVEGDYIMATEEDIVNSEDDSSLESEINDAISGTIYLQYQLGKDKIDEEDVREELAKKLEIWRIQKKDSFVVEDENEDILSAVEDVIVPRGIVRSFYLSNCSHKKRECSNKKCPLNLDFNERTTSCPLTKNDCSRVILRPVCNLPRMESMFPGNEILAVKANLKYCAVENNGSVLAILDYVWVPKCEKRIYEIEIAAQTIWGQTNAWDRRPNNVLGEKVISQLPPISMITFRNLEEWQNYLDWRTQLIRESKIGIRYLSWQIDPDNMTISFIVVSPSLEDLNRHQFWKKDDVFAYPLSNSSDPWVFRDDNSDSGKKRKAFGEALGDFIEKSPSAVPKLSDCPWDRPCAVKLSFSLPDEIREDVEDRLVSEKDSDNEFDVESFINDNINIPATGFLSLSYVGDESLINRMKMTLKDFASNGSNNSPFLSTFLFDISKARIPQTRFIVANYLNQELNDNQKETIETMLSAPDIALIQGPPGTGKTTVIAEAIYQLVLQGKKVLLSSQSIAAVDNALDRLENIPEIRAIRLKKNTKYSRDLDDNSRYSETDVLRNFYDTLGIKTRKRLETFQQDEKSLEQLNRYIPELESYQTRISIENNLIKTNIDKYTDIEKKYNEAKDANQKNEGAKQQKLSMESLINYLSSAISRTGDKPNNFEETESLPTKSFDIFEATLLPVFEQYNQHGIDFFVAPWNFGWTSSQKMDVITSLLKDYYSFGQCIALVTKDLSYFKSLSSDKIISVEDSVLIGEKSRLEQELRQKMDKAEQDGDEDLYGKLQKEHRIVRRERLALEAKASFPAEKYRPYFKRNNSNGINVIQYITDPSRTKDEMVSFFENLIAALLQLEKRVFVAAEEFKAGINSVISSLAISDDSAKKCNLYRLQMEETQRNIQEAQARMAGQIDASIKKLTEASRVLSYKFKDLEQAVSWCKVSRDVLSKRIHEREEELKFFKPLWDEWLSALQNITQTDKDIVFGTYLQSCSVVGITCTADNRILTDRGFDSFDVVIIDEVSKATPPELLLPLLMARKVVLVGDHRQLPPLFGEKEPSTMEEIVQRQEEENVPVELRVTEENFRKYKKMVEASLFKSSFESADKQLKSSLWTQYRMHPDIMQIINEFYENRLQCGLENPDEKRAHNLNIQKIPYLQKERHAYWIDSTTDPSGDFYEEDQHDNGSKSNYLELQLILKMLQDIDSSLEGVFDENGIQIRKNVAVIAFYGKQKALLKREINKMRFKNIRCKIETVDRFQGQERDFVLVSMTRNKRNNVRKSSKAFVAQFERINVAFSRARELLLIFGAKSMFFNYEISLPPLETQGPPKKSQVYRRILECLDRKGCLISSDRILSKKIWQELSLKKQKQQVKTNKRSADGGRVWNDGRGKK